MDPTLQQMLSEVVNLTIQARKLEGQVNELTKERDELKKRLMKYEPIEAKPDGKANGKTAPGKRKRTPKKKPAAQPTQ